MTEGLGKYIYIYIYSAKEIWHPNTFGCLRMMVTGKNQRMDYSSMQNNGKKDCLSLPPSQSLQGDVGVGGPHSLLAMCISAGRQAFDHIWYQERADQENQHMVNFQTTED